MFHQSGYTIFEHTIFNKSRECMLKCIWNASFSTSNAIYNYLENCLPPRNRTFFKETIEKLNNLSNSLFVLCHISQQIIVVGILLRLIISVYVMHILNEVLTPWFESPSSGADLAGWLFVALALPNFCVTDVCLTHIKYMWLPKDICWNRPHNVVDKEITQWVRKFELLSIKGPVKWP